MMNPLENKVIIKKGMNTSRGQMVMGEYLMTFFLVASVVTAMSVYFRRAIQARIRDARQTMVREVFARTNGNFVGGNLYLEYEPYYFNTITDVARDETYVDNLQGGGSTGIFTKTIDSTITASVTSETAPPKDRD